MTDKPGYRRPQEGTQPEYLHPTYQSTNLRSPSKHLVFLPHSLSEITGATVGAETVNEKDNDLIRKIYVQLSNTQEYKTYIAIGSREKAAEKAILDYILNDLLLANESFTSHIEDLFSNWEDDGEMIVQLLVGFMQKPGSLDFQHLLGPDKEQFAKKLLQTVLDKSDHLQTLIVPKLKNWDPERIAHLDMILMKMGVAEFLYFETIPPKVTINEYIDLAKDYSTAQSGQFVNGILDNIHKELVQDGKMQKSEYKKQ